jgi:hypothetical protein
MDPMVIAQFNPTAQYVLHPVRASILDLGRESLLNFYSLNIQNEHAGSIDIAYILFETIG